MATQDDSPIGPPRETLRAVDWVGLAPWLLLLRAPGALVGKPLLLGMIGTLLLTGTPDPEAYAPANLEECLRAATDGFTAAPDAVARHWDASRPPASVAAWAWLLFRAAVWGWIGLAIVDHVARRLTGSGGVRFVGLIKRATARWPKLLGAVGLSGGAVLLLFGCLTAVGWLSQGVGLSRVVAACWFLPVALLGVPFVVLLAGLVVGWPLLMAAIAVDAADAFDAVSRMYAYAYQRLARLAWYVLVAAAVGVVTATAVEAAASLAFHATGYGVGGLRDDATAQTLIRWWESVLARLVDGYYPAYFFTAATAIYLLLRRDIDGQPIDEMQRDGAGVDRAPADQASPAA